MIRCRFFLSLILLLIGVLSGLALWAQRSTADYLAEDLPSRRQLVARLSLTDLSLWTEARYTRHPSVADLFSPFQDFPGAFEHFPAGGLMAPTGPRPDTLLSVRRKAVP
jgi:hypothetical protein